MKLEKIKFLIGLCHDKDFSDNIIDFEFNDGVYTLICKNDSNSYVKYTVSKRESDIKIIKDLEDNMSCYNVKLRKIFDRYFGEVTLNFDKQIMYEFNTDVIKKSVNEINIISENEYDVVKKRGR